MAAKIKAIPPNPAAIRLAAGSLAEALRQAPSDPNFDLDTWTEEWATIEAEQKAITRANDLAKGTGLTSMTSFVYHNEGKTGLVDILWVQSRTFYGLNDRLCIL